MDTLLDLSLAEKYKNSSQKIRVLTEDWVGSQIYCPNCGQTNFGKYPNNAPVADFFCENCREDYELKSKENNIGNKIVDGAYKTMMERLQSEHNPNFFLLSYNEGFEVINFLVIPKHFFIQEIIEKRNPLSNMARRAGWVGCNIVMDSIPESGKIFFIKNKIVESKGKVLAEWQKTLFLRQEKEIAAKGWLFDTMKCIEKLKKQQFFLDEIYAFENELKAKHPENKHIKDKLRQQLQILRDKGYLSFLGNGQYKLA